ncbi:MAG TPA: DUF4398 domain-containing protein [Candidatus Bilamarchaeaceae archaeon]|nr:DUF4398 domain-containing protein [Candidatus Bilamarchaeaceae archaeon]
MFKKLFLFSMLVISLSFSPLADEPSVELSDVDVNFLSDPPTAPNITFKFTDPRNDKVLYKISCTLSYAGEEYSPTNYPLKSTANTETGELVFERVKEGLNKMKCANIHYQNNRGYKNILYTFTVLPSQKIEEAPIPEEDQVIIEDNSSEQPQPEEPPPYFEEAKVTVTEAEQAIETATNELRVVGLDNAEQKLEQAKTAFENGDYENAKGLAAEAKQLADNAIKEAEKIDKKKDQTPANKTSGSQQNKTQSDTGTGATTNDLDLTMVFGALIIILIVLFFLSKFFGSKNEQKD